MTEPRIIAEVKDYAGLVLALRGRIAELNVAGETIDDVAGLPLRYTMKLLAPIQKKTIGRVSLGPLLGTLGIKLHVVEDPEVFERIRPRLVPRKDGRRNAGEQMLASKGRRKPFNVLRAILSGHDFCGQYRCCNRARLSVRVLPG